MANHFKDLSPKKQHSNGNYY
uniref:Uncharacterized protein n=1 Tax=Anguilla anguilla TaxID=7936 RepID=A0A0E9TXX2_ANGAN